MTDAEKVRHLVRAIDNIALILNGDRTEIAINNLIAYVGRQRDEIRIWEDED